MILTGKAAKHAEDFEVFDKEIQQMFPDYKPPELTEDEQITLFHITTMFERSEAFKGFMSACLTLYTQKVLEGKEAFLRMLLKMSEL